MVNRLGHFIDGERVQKVNSRYADVFNPASGEIIARVLLASNHEVRQAVEAAAGQEPSDLHE